LMMPPAAYRRSATASVHPQSTLGIEHGGLGQIQLQGDVVALAHLIGREASEETLSVDGEHHVIFGSGRLNAFDNSVEPLARWGNGYVLRPKANEYTLT